MEHLYVKHLSCENLGYSKTCFDNRIMPVAFPSKVYSSNSPNKFSLTCRWPQRRQGVIVYRRSQGLLDFLMHCVPPRSRRTPSTPFGACSERTRTPSSWPPCAARMEVAVAVHIPAEVFVGVQMQGIYSTGRCPPIHRDESASASLCSPAVMTVAPVFTSWRFWRRGVSGRVVARGCTCWHRSI